MNTLWYTCFINQCVLFIIIVHVNGQTISYTDKVFIEIALDSDIEEVTNGVRQYDIIFVEKILPSLYLFQHKGGDASNVDDGILQQVKKSLNGKITNIEKVPIHRYEIEKEPSTDRSFFLGFSYVPSARTLFTQKTCYGMGVQTAWNEGYSGKGVVIAVVDVGVDKDIPDLEPAIDMELSKNFVEDTPQGVAPDKLMSYHESWAISDHGNRCSGLIAASSLVGSCCTGIAFSAKIAVLKVFTVEEDNWWMSLSADHATKALCHYNDKISIYSNSWAIDQPFQSLHFYSNKVLQHGIDMGRDGKGNIYVFPVGGIAEGYTNSIYTVTINSFGFQGSKAVFTGQPCACILTSTFGQGDSHNTTFMDTTSYFHNNCTRDFKGTSASTAMISAMVALALEANDRLTWRDIQHLLVESSDSRFLDESRMFKLNGAGKKYHYLFGFGSLDASRLVSLAKSWTNVPKQLTIWNTTNTFRQRNKGNIYVSFEYIDMYCGTDLPSCINRIEHVVTKISYVTPNETATEIAIKSPSGTVSVLMDMRQSNVRNEAIRDNVEFLSVHFWGEKMNGKWTIIQKTYASESLKLSGKFGITACMLSISGDVIPNDNYIRLTTVSPSTMEDVTTKETKKQHNELSSIKSSFYVILISMICYFTLHFICVTIANY